MDSLTDLPQRVLLDETEMAQNHFLFGKLQTTIAEDQTW